MLSGKSGAAPKAITFRVETNSNSPASLEEGGGGKGREEDSALAAMGIKDQG